MATHLALAFEQTGLATFDAAGARAPETVADSRADYRINLLIGALERYGAP